MRISENQVKIEGILSEVGLETATFNRKGQTTECIRGTIKIRVEQDINGTITTMEVPVSAFASRYTNAGAENPAYNSLKDVMENYKSIAACGNIDDADRVRITNGSLQENVFYAKNGDLVNTSRISASFINKIAKNECKPEATFTATIVVGNKSDELDRDGTPTNRLNVNGVIIQYGERADLIKFIVAKPDAKNHIEQYWNDGDTVRVQGKVNFSSKTEYIEEEVGFGEPIKTAKTTSVHELLIESGSAGCLEGDAAYDIKDIQSALAARKVRIEETKKPIVSAPSKPDFGF
jgi:hypothetical protein|nr:MAG TPA: hypothetical protein [Caudoviricetes sp.]